MKYTNWTAKNLEEDQSYKVHSVYKRTVNILVKDRILAFQPEILEKTPVSISIPLSEKEFAAFAEEAKKEEDVFIGNDKLWVGRKSWDTGKCEIWDCRLRKHLSVENTSFLEKEIEAFLFEIGSAYDGMSDCAIHFEKKEKDSLITRVMREMILETYSCGLKNPKELSKILSGMIGLGMGLTPSGDDFLTGLMISFHVVSSVYEKEKEILMKDISGFFDRTNDISRQYLSCAFYGEASYVWHELFNDWDDKEKIKQRLFRIQQIGHSSGIDTLNGVYAGIKLMGDR